MSLSGGFRNVVGRGHAFLGALGAALVLGTVSTPVSAGLLTEYDLDNDGNIDSLRLGDKVYYLGGELPKYSEAAAINNILGVNGFTLATQAELPGFLSTLVTEYGDLYSSPLFVSPDSNLFWTLGGSYYDYSSGTFTFSSNSDDVANAPLVVILQNQTIPEPGTLALAGLALVGVAGAGAITRRKQSSPAVAP